MGFHQANEFLAKLEAAGFTPDDVQRLIDWPGNALAHEIVAGLRLVQLYTAGTLEHVILDIRAGASAEEVADKYFRSSALGADVRFRRAKEPDPALLAAAAERWAEHFEADAAVYKHRQEGEVYVAHNFPSVNVGPRGYEPGAYIVKVDGWFGEQVATFRNPDDAFLFAHHKALSMQAASQAR